MRERFLISRDLTGHWDKSRPEDKLDTLTSSFFAPIAQNPPSQSFDLLNGYIYLDNSFIERPDTVIGLGTVGSHPTNPIPANFYNVAYISLSSVGGSQGTVIKTEGTPAATPGAVVPPIGGFPAGTFPIAIVSYQDNGASGVGTIFPLTPANIKDVRPFFYGSYGKTTYFSDTVNDLKVRAVAPAAKQVTVEKGYVYFNSGEYAELLSQQLVDFAIPGPFYSPAIPAGFYNKCLLSLTTFGTLIVTWGTPAVTANAVLPPPNPKDASALALITVQDDGSATAGSILPITAIDIKDVRPFLNNFFGQVDVTNLSWCRVLAHNPADYQVKINSGVVYPEGNLTNFAGAVIDFSAAGTYQFPASTPGFFRKALLGVTSANTVYFAISDEAINPNLVVKPPIPNTVIPFAYVTLMDDGAGIPGSINPVNPTDIEDIRPFLGGSGAGNVISLVEKQQLYSDFLLESYFRQGFYEDFTTTDFIGAGTTPGCVDDVVKNICVLQPGDVLISTKNSDAHPIYDSSYYQLQVNVDKAIILIDCDNLSSLLIEGSNNGGATWETFTFNTVHTFASVGTNLQVKITNTAVTPITIFSYGICYNDLPFPGDQPGSVPSRMSYTLEYKKLLRKFLTSIKDNAVVDTNNIAQIAKDLYRNGISQLTDNGNKSLPGIYTIQALLANVKAVVGSNGTHTNLQSAISDPNIAAGSLILVDSETFVVNSQIDVNKSNLTILGCGRGSQLSGVGGITGLNITAPGVKIEGLKINNFSTGIKVAAENCMLMQNYFLSNTTDIDHSGITNVVIEGNIGE